MAIDFRKMVIFLLVLTGVCQRPSSTGAAKVPGGLIEEQKQANAAIRQTVNGVLRRASGSVFGHEDSRPNELQVIIIGDYGERLLQGQEAVAQAMANWAANNTPAYIVSTGDNIYPNGIGSWDDPQVWTKWRDVYVQPSIAGLVWHQSIGNHDYGNDNGVEWNQVELTNHDARWYMPHLWYDYLEDVGDHTVHFIHIDTEAYRKQVNNYTDMVTWLDSTLSQSTADWKLVVGHRNVFSAGDHGPVSETLLFGLVPIMEQYNVDVYLCGHDHNLQHISNISGYGMDYIVNGAGGALIYIYDEANADYILQNYGMATRFFRASFGFMTLTTRKTELTFNFYSRENEFLYRYVRYPRTRAEREVVEDVENNLH